MYFKLEYLRIIHYFYFFLGIIDIFLAVLSWGEFKKISIVIATIGFINLYFSYIANLKIQELFIESKIYSILAHLLIVSMAISYYYVSLIKIPFFAFLQTLLLITSYIGIFTLLIIFLGKFDFNRKILLFLGISKQHRGMYKVIFLEKEKKAAFENLFILADIDMLKSYVIGTSKKIDDLLCDIEDTTTTNNRLWKIKFLFIYLYEREIEQNEDSSEKEKNKKIISLLKKQLDYD